MEIETEFGGNLSVLFRKIKLKWMDAQSYIDAGNLSPTAGIVVGDYIYYDESACSDKVKNHFGVLDNGEKVWLQKPLIFLGHNKCIFKQYIFVSKNWKSDQGVTPLIPKDEGQGVMINAFQSR